jgi:hypothetical protein
VCSSEGRERPEAIAHFQGHVARHPARLPVMEKEMAAIGGRGGDPIPVL